ncbi:hypothetical protein VTN00DRAFT_4595 [Thermoascus crustaceus]|uniref:uncharacterized protein n=1 Tax=Thermoascus crustaceus TaxID=5088 RepID=UPI003741F63A
MDQGPRWIMAIALDPLSHDRLLLLLFQHSSLGAKVDLLGITMPVPCSRCLLLREKGEEVECKVYLNYSCCGECCRQGHTQCDATGVEDADFNQLKRALDKARADREAACRELNAAMARLARVEKQTDLLERQGVLMLTKKAQSVEDLEELERSEAILWLQAIWVSKVEFLEEFLAPTAVFYGLPRILKVIITLPFQKS